MSFEFDPTGSGDPSLPQAHKIDTQESADDRQTRSLVKIDYNLCEGSGVCEQVCPEDVFSHTDGHTHVANPAQCTECWICAEHCTSGALDIG